MSKKPPRMARARMEVLTDILLMLAELPDEADAEAVIMCLYNMRSTGHLDAMFRPCDLPATTRQDLCARMVIGRTATHPSQDSMVIIKDIVGDEARIEHESGHAWVKIAHLELTP